MSQKQRPQIPPPKMTPPARGDEVSSGFAAEQARASQAQAQAQVARETPPAPVLAVVPPPARVASMKITPLGVEYTNPTIDLAHWVFLQHEGKPVQTNKLTPVFAVVSHGLLIIDEYRLSISTTGATIRT